MPEPLGVFDHAADPLPPIYFPDEPKKYHWPDPPPNHTHIPMQCVECQGVVVLDYLVRRGQVYCPGCATVEG